MIAPARTHTLKRLTVCGWVEIEEVAAEILRRDQPSAFLGQRLRDAGFKALHHAEQDDHEARLAIEAGCFELALAWGLKEVAA